MEDFELIYEYFFDNTPMYVAVISSYKTLHRANKPLLDFVKKDLDELVGTEYYELPWWQESSELLNKLMFSVEEAFMGGTARFSATHVDYKGEMHEIDFQLRPIVQEDMIPYVLAIGYNITELVSTQKSLTNREKEIKAFFDNFNDGFFFLMLPESIPMDNLTDEKIVKIIENQRIKSINNVVAELLGEDYRDHIKLFEHLGINEGKRLSIWNEMLESGRSEFMANIINHKTNNTVNLSVTINRIINEDGLFDGNFVIFRDITNEQNYIRQLSFLAKKDSLTELNNRRSFFEEATLLYSDALDSHLRFYLTIMDIDFFKHVNDTYGHDWGDIVLKRFAELLLDLVPKDAVLARYGGEEFILASVCSQQAFEELLETIRLKTMELQFSHPKGNFGITTSFGFSMSTETYPELNLIINNADKALYESKRNGRNRATMFLEEIHGTEAYDQFCNVLKEKSLLYRINQLILENVMQKNEYFTAVCFSIQFIKDVEDDVRAKYLSTLALCVNKAIRKEDFAGRYLEDGIMVVFPMLLQKQVSDIITKIIHNITIGFNFVLHDSIEMEISVTDSKQDSYGLNALVSSIKRNKRVLSL